MPEGIKLNFSDEGVKILTDEKVDAFDAEVQNALMNIGVLNGSDPIYADRGTTLFIKGLQGRMTNSITAGHEANYAAVDTLFFVREEDPFTDHDPVNLIELEIESFEIGRMSINTVMTSVAGEVQGSSLTL